VTELGTALTLAEKSRRLAALARSKTQSAADDDARARLERQIHALTLEVDLLKTALATHDALVAKGVIVESLPSLHVPWKEVADHVARIGRPSPQFLQHRVSAVRKAQEQIVSADAESWMSWAGGQIDGLPLGLIPRLGGFRRSENERRLKQLRDFARKAPDPGMVTQFLILLDSLGNDLALVETAGVDAVLDRFKNGRILLAELSDEEVALLQGDEALRDQIYVSLA